MKFSEDMAAIHGYLCADGYVIKNPPSQKHKYYYIGLRNTNDVLLKDFQQRFHRDFGIKPIITNDGRCKIQNKEIFHILTENFTYYSNKWTMPKIPRRLLSAWLRSYFDCDGWVSVIKAKDRKIGLDSINRKGLFEIKKSLKENFDINSSVKKRKTRDIWSMAICGKDDLEKFQKNIGFLHPKKASKLKEALNSYVNYRWEIPESRQDIIKFVKNKGKFSTKRKEIRICSILNINLKELKQGLELLGIKSTVLGPWKNNWGTSYYTLSIKEKEFSKLKEVK